MDDHPIILEQWVAAGTIFRDQVRVDNEAIILQYVTHQHKRRAAYFDISKYYPEDHGGQKGLYGCKYSHDRGFPFFVGFNDDQTENGLPKRPDQEAAFLPLPKGSNHVFGGQVQRRMAPGVVVLEIMVVNDGKQNGHHTKHGNAVHNEHNAPELAP